VAGYREFASGEVLTAVNVNDFLMKQSTMVFVDAAARTAALDGAEVEGMLTYNLDTARLEVYDGSAFISAAPFVKQIVRATDTTQRTTTSTSYVDANLSVTITPTATDSRILLAAIYYAQVNAAGTGEQRISIRITDSSSVAISGAQDARIGVDFGSVITSFAGMVNTWALDTPGVTTATTYKVRFRTLNALNTAVLANAQTTAQLYAIEVAA
jgi:hypothetical protein